MHLVRFVGAAALVAAVVAAWLHRSVVIAAYTSEREPVEVTFDGFELDVVVEELGPSPYELDVRRPQLSAAPAGMRPVPVAAPGSEPPPVVGGRNVIEGTVRDPFGAPVPGAIVNVERHTDQGRGRLEATADASGAFRLSGLRGGRYVVRSWVPFESTMPEPTSFFLDADQDVDLDLTVSPAAGSARAEVVLSPAALVGGRLQAAVLVGYESVDGDGRLVVTPEAGRQVSMWVEGPVSIVGNASGATGSDGLFGVRIACDGVGAGRLSVDVAVRPAPEPPPDTGPDDSPPVGAPVATGSGAASVTVALPTCLDPSSSPPEGPAGDGGVAEVGDGGVDTEVGG